MSPDPLLSRAAAAIDEAHSLRVDRRAVLENLDLSRAQLRETVLASGTTRERFQRRSEVKSPKFQTDVPAKLGQPLSELWTGALKVGQHTRFVPPGQ
jgi:hypothetical protein